MQYIRQVPELEPLYKGVDHVDVKVAEGQCSLQTFVAGAMGYQPEWVTFLYGVRGVFVRFLGMRQDGIPQPLRLRAADVPMTPGQKLSFFTVQMVDEDRYWVAAISDSHLDAALSVVVEPLSGDRKRFHVMTTVHYHNLAGVIYFNVIRPFHHLVVGSMVKAAVQHA